MMPLLLLGLLAINLRPALTGVGPLIEQIRQGTGISLSVAGLLMSSSLVVLGIFAPLGNLSRRYGIERAVVVALALLAAGLLIRSHGSVWGLLLGSLCLAGGIAIGNVLAPSIIKRDFPEQVQLATMIYAVTMGVASAVASGVAVPLSGYLPGGWRSALAIWAVPAVLALIAWLSRIKHVKVEAIAPSDTRDASLWRSGLAWLVALFMGLQSGQFYVVVVWFPTVLQQAGHGLVEAGWLIATYQLVALAFSLFVPLLLKRSRDQSVMAMAASLLVSGTILGVALMPQWAYFWMILMGMGGGMCLVLSLVFIGMRSSNHQQAAGLAVMTQFVGFLMAAAAPFVSGWMYERMGNWWMPMAVFASLGVVQAAIGYAAGKDRVLA